MILFLLLISSFSILITSEYSPSVTMATNLPKTMKAVGLYKYLPLSDPSCLLDLQLNLPSVQKDEVLVEVKAISVNPIDTKLRAPKPNIESSPRILGWDGSGTVVARGNGCKLFNIGDHVFFTGDIRKNGCNAQYVALNEISVGSKPKNLTFEEAAAMPLTAVTAYESLFDRLMLSKNDAGKSLLIINSAGGVGAVASQLANNLGLKVIGTTSRKETENFSLAHGAHFVLNHTKDLLPQLEEKGFREVDYIMVNYDPYPYWDTLMKAIKPQGKICLIVDSSGLVDLKALKEKSLTLAWEMMFTRIKYETEDVFRHHEILQEISKMLESGALKSTLTKVLSPINAENIKEAHRLLEIKQMIGKLVVSGF